jgi:hypothetical protein
MSAKHKPTSETRLTGKLAFLLCLCCFPLASVKAQSQRFFDPPFFPTTTFVNALVVDDFNEDGLPDVATSNGADEVNILLGRGDGTFGEAQSYDGGTDPVEIAVGDFNGDGHLDLVTRNPADPYVKVLVPEEGINVLLGNGDGTFQNSVSFDAGHNPSAVAIADFNSDGNQDIAVGNYDDKRGNVSVLFGNGDGTFAEPTGYTTALGAGSPVAGDFNGDGNFDLAVTAFIDQVVSVLLGNGDGTFQEHQDFAAGYLPTRLDLGDFNGDSKLDLVTAGFELSVFHILLGNGDGTFQAPTDTTTPQPPEHLAVDDLDGDGLVDLAVTADGELLSIFLGNGDGTFRMGMSYGEAVEIDMGDFDRNGTIDLVSTFSRYPDYGVIVIAGNGDGTFQARTELPSRNNAQTQTLGDVNGDGKPDIVASVYYYNLVSVFLNDGDGNFPTRTDYPTGTNPWGIALGDVNNDGNTDLAVTNSEGPSYSVSVLLGNGDGTFQPKSDFPTASEPRGIVLSDFNGDGNLDAATANNINFYLFEPGSISLLFGNGDGTFSAHEEIRAGDEPWSITTDDLNGDGNTDLVVTYATASGATVSQDVSVFLSNGDGTFQPRVDYPLQLGASYGSHAVATGDINRDSKPDLIVSNEFGTVAVFLGNGDGTFQPHVDYPVNTSSRSCVVGDFNGDGYPDVVTGDVGYYNNLGTISLLLGNGDGTFQSYVKYLAGSPYSISGADLNGDGALDLATSNLYGDSVSILFNLGGSRVSLISSKNPSQPGEPITFTAKVIPAFPSVFPSGGVKFFDGDNVLGTATLDGNTATLTRTTKKVGIHQIKANYLGDSTFVPTRSKTLSQKIRPKPLTAGRLRFILQPSAWFERTSLCWALSIAPD